MYQTNSSTVASNSKKLILLILVLATNQLFAAYEIRKHTINNGGTEASSPRYQLKGSIAQVDANTTISSNNYQLSPGFWQQNTDLIFTNGFK